jgi:hypothetical protein
MSTNTHHEQQLQSPYTSRRRRRRRQRDDTSDDDDQMDNFNEKYYCPDSDPYWSPTSIVTATFVMGIIFILLSIILSMDVVSDPMSDHRNIKDMATSASTNNRRQLPQQSSTSSSWYASLLQLRHHRFMWALTDEEVQERIFERHDDEPPTRSAITPAPVVTKAPQAVNIPTMKLPSAVNVPSGPTGMKIPTVATPTSTKAPAIVISPTMPKVPSVVITSAPDTTSMTEFPTITPTPDSGAKVTTVPFGQVSPTISPEDGGTTRAPDISSGGPTKAPTIVLPTTMQSVSPVPSLIPAPSISTNGTTTTPAATAIPILAPSFENNSTTATDAPTVMNETLPSDEPSLIPIAAVPTIPNQNETSRSPTINTGNETMVTETPSLSPNSNISISIGPTPIESTQRFIERVLLLETDALKQPNTYRNQAYTSLTETFPDLTPMNNNQIEIIQIYTLNTIYFTLNGTEWKQRISWTGPNEPCTNPVWYGVTCNADGIITKLDLSSNDLFGTIPPDIQGLSNLGMCELVTKNCIRISVQKPHVF